MRLVFGCNEAQLSCFYQQYLVTNPSPFSQCKKMQMQSLFSDFSEWLELRTVSKISEKTPIKIILGTEWLTSSHLEI